MGVLVSVSDLTVAFGGVAALTDVNIEIEEGSFHGLIGPNGAGKTTLLNCISRLVNPRSGRMAYGETDLLALRPNQLAGIGITRTFQNFGLIAQFSTLENVMAGMYSRHPGTLLDDFLFVNRRNAAEAEVRRRAAEAIDFVGLSKFVDSAAVTLPYGRRKAIELARALAPRPRLLLLDEPTAGLNHGEMDELKALLTKLRASGVTVLIITHHVEFLREIADVVTVLHLGCRIAHGAPVEVTTDPKVVAAYIGGATA
jgi:ABC-type branched-subunit amino acid transport system ATPase component